jgi:hypothetical protein
VDFLHRHAIMKRAYEHLTTAQKAHVVSLHGGTRRPTGRAPRDQEGRDKLWDWRTGQWFDPPEGSSQRPPVASSWHRATVNLSTGKVAWAVQPPAAKQASISRVPTISVASTVPALQLTDCSTSTCQLLAPTSCEPTNLLTTAACISHAAVGVIETRESTAMVAFEPTSVTATDDPFDELDAQSEHDERNDDEHVATAPLAPTMAAAPPPGRQQLLQALDMEQLGTLSFLDRKQRAELRVDGVDHEIGAIVGQRLCEMRAALARGGEAAGRIQRRMQGLVTLANSIVRRIIRERKELGELPSAPLSERHVRRLEGASGVISVRSENGSDLMVVIRWCRL